MSAARRNGEGGEAGQKLRHTAQPSPSPKKELVVKERERGRYKLTRRRRWHDCMSDTGGMGRRWVVVGMCVCVLRSARRSIMCVCDINTTKWSLLRRCVHVCEVCVMGWRVGKANGVACVAAGQAGSGGRQGEGEEVLARRQCNCL